MNQIKEALMLLEHINIYSVFFRILLATAIGGFIGVDRGRHGRVAGTRTHILVCLGAAVTTLVGFYTAEHLGYNNDPLRMGAQVISGVGFLGVGTIVVRNKSQVRGLTTAAGLWTTACIGLAVGAGFYSVALISFITVIVTVSVLARLEHRFRGSGAGLYYIELEDLASAKEFYDHMNSHITMAEIVPARSGITNHVGMELTVEERAARHEVFEELRNDPNIAIAVPLHT